MFEACGRGGGTGEKIIRVVVVVHSDAGGAHLDGVGEQNGGGGEGTGGDARLNTMSEGATRSQRSIYELTTSSVEHCVHCERRDLGDFYSKSSRRKSSSSESSEEQVGRERHRITSK